MKRLLSSTFFKNVLVGCMIFTTWISSSHASIYFFGEYPYPKKEDYTSPTQCDPRGAFFIS